MPRSRTKVPKEKVVKPKVSQKPKGTPKKPRVISEKEYAASLEMNGQNINGSGMTAMEALSNIALPKSLLMKTKAYIHLAHAGKTASQMIYAIQLRRFATGRVSREIFAKRLEARLA